jgi:ankyrin repeat protein
VRDGVAFSATTARKALQGKEGGAGREGLTPGFSPRAGGGPGTPNLATEWAAVRTQPRRAPKRSALIEAAMVGEAPRVITLLRKTSKHGALDAADRRGCTAYHHACGGGHTTVAELLVRAGCDTGCLSDGGKTGWDLAAEARRADVVALLALLAAESPDGGTMRKLWLEERHGASRVRAAAAEVEAAERRSWAVSPTAAELAAAEAADRMPLSPRGPSGR